MLRCNDFRCDFVRVGFEIFWSAIEAVGIDALGELANQEYIFCLKDLFIKVIKQGYKLEDKCLRNEILILINYIISLPQTVELFLAKRETESGKK